MYAIPYTQALINVKIFYSHLAECGKDQSFGKLNLIWVIQITNTIYGLDYFFYY